MSPLRQSAQWELRHDPSGPLPYHPSSPQGLSVKGKRVSMGAAETHSSSVSLCLTPLKHLECPPAPVGDLKILMASIVDGLRSKVDTLS